MSLQILVHIRVREILSQNLWLLPRPISDALIQYIVKPETQGLSLYNSYTYVSDLGPLLGFFGGDIGSVPSGSRTA